MTLLIKELIEAIQTSERIEQLGLHGKVMKQMRREMLALQFPQDKKQIARLSYDNKMEWYAYQFEKNPGAYPIHLLTGEFKRFWKWRVLIPMKIKRFFYRVKNGEIFKKYEHISEMKKKVKKHSI